MKITKKQIIKIIKEEYQRVLNENHGEHRCMDGSMVQSDSGECYDDILNILGTYISF